MKKLNNKGFTLIELLAVIVILAILVALSVPAVTKYLSGARKDTFVTNAQTAISTVRNDVMSNFATNTSGDYNLEEINALLDKKLNKSSYGNAYAGASFVYYTIDATTGSATYSVCISDGTYRIYETEADITTDSVEATTDACPASPAHP